jgi:hypothetical protein|tara:strand:+ start:222 stop:725 length:504 start_codon:yes stop_codon:yes gene_type:complete
MKLKREHQIIRLENGLAKGMGGDTEEMLQGTLSLYHAATPEMRKVYWSAIKAMVEWNYDLHRYMMGRIPFSVKREIHQIADTARNELYQAYINIQNDLGFLPIKVNTEELGQTHAIAHDASMKVFRSIKRRLTMAYKAGGWDGSVESAPNHFGQRSLDAPDFTEVFE